MCDAGAGTAGEQVQQRRRERGGEDRRSVRARAGAGGGRPQHAVSKRPPARPAPAHAHNSLCLTKHTDFKAQLEKCCELITSGEKEVFIHGLGAAVQRCCNLALQLEALFAGTCRVEVNTGTVDLIDDLEPLTDDADYGTQVRQSSSVHIRIYRTAVLGANQ